MLKTFMRQAGIFIKSSHDGRRNLLERDRQQRLWPLTWYFMLSKSLDCLAMYMESYLILISVRCQLRNQYGFQSQHSQPLTS